MADADSDELEGPRSRIGRAFTPSDDYDFADWAQDAWGHMLTDFACAMGDPPASLAPFANHHYLTTAQKGSGRGPRGGPGRALREEVAKG